MRRVIVQDSFDSVSLSEIQQYQDSFEFIISSDNDLARTLNDNSLDIDGLIATHLSPAVLRFCDMIRNERFCNPMIPVALVADHDPDTPIPYGACRFNNTREAGFFDHVMTNLKPSILVVEDDPGIRDVLQLALSKHFLVTTSNDGSQGLSLILENQYDCVVLDVMLPGIDGNQIFEKAIAVKPTLPFVIITAYDTQESELNFMFNGAYAYLRKPFQDNYIIRKAVLDSIIAAHNDEARIILAQRNSEMTAIDDEYRNKMSKYI